MSSAGGDDSSLDHEAGAIVVDAVTRHMARPSLASSTRLFDALVLYESLTASEQAAIREMVRQMTGDDVILRSPA